MHIREYQELAVMTLQTIICPTDFSEASYAALQKAADLTYGSNAEICLLHVELPISLPPQLGHTWSRKRDVARRAEAVSNLCQVPNQRLAPSVRYRALLKSGDAATEIVKAAREESANLIVLTRHGAGTAQPDILGRVAAAVIRTAPCPVLTVSVGACDSTRVSVSEANVDFDVYDGVPAAIELVSSKVLILAGD